MYNTHEIEISSSTAQVVPKRVLVTPYLPPHSPLFGCGDGGGESSPRVTCPTYTARRTLQPAKRNRTVVGIFGPSGSHAWKPVLACGSRIWGSCWSREYRVQVKLRTSPAVGSRDVRRALISKQTRKWTRSTGWRKPVTARFRTSYGRPGGLFSVGVRPATTVKENKKRTGRRK